MENKEKYELFSKDLCKMMEENEYYELCENIMINQDLKLIEELNELSSALAKNMSRNDGILVGNDDILDEMADVIVCIKGYIERHQIPSSYIMSKIKYKLERFKLTKNTNKWEEMSNELKYKNYMQALLDKSMDVKKRNKLLELNDSINSVYLITKWRENVKKIITTCFDTDVSYEALGNLDIIYKSLLNKIQEEK